MYSTKMPCNITAPSLTKDKCNALSQFSLTESNCRWTCGGVVLGRDPACVAASIFQLGWVGTGLATLLLGG